LIKAMSNEEVETFKSEALKSRIKATLSNNNTIMDKFINDQAKAL
jgi:hypothetical protein